VGGSEIFLAHLAQLLRPRGVNWCLCEDRRKPVRRRRPVSSGQGPEFGYRSPAHGDREALPTFGAPEHVAYLVTELTLWNRGRHDDKRSSLATSLGALCADSDPAGFPSDRGIRRALQ
jgi:hypothetical protein